MLTERQFDTGEVVINYAEGETVGPPLVMLHGATLNWQSFMDLIPTLERNWRVYACDLRGHGKSGRAATPHHHGNFVRDTVAFIDGRVVEPVVLAGFSLGGAIALGVAAVRPDLVRALILFDPPLAYCRDHGVQSFPGPYEWC
jgi:pimeloyl-ACP methyl ester carboxylesterase